MINIYEPIEIKPFDKNPEEYENYFKGLHDSLKYNVSFLEQEDTSYKVVRSFSDFMVSLNKKTEKKFLLDLSIFSQKGFLLFSNSKEYVKPKDHLDIILAVLLAIPTIMSNVIRIKSVTDELYKVAGQGALFKDDKLIFKMDQLEGYISAARKHINDIGLNIIYDESSNTIEIPYGNLVFRQFSVKEIVLIVSSILSVFKYVYAQNNSGKDFNDRFNILAELEKWKKSRSLDLAMIEKRILTVENE